MLRFHECGQCALFEGHRCKLSRSGLRHLFGGFSHVSIVCQCIFNGRNLLQRQCRSYSTSPTTTPANSLFRTHCPLHSKGGYLVASKQNIPSSQAARLNMASPIGSLTRMLRLSSVADNPLAVVFILRISRVSFSMTNSIPGVADFGYRAATV